MNSPSESRHAPPTSLSPADVAAALKRIVRLSARTLGVPSAQFTTFNGQGVGYGPAGEAELCGLGIERMMAGRGIVVADTSGVPAFARLAPGVRFFAAAPIGTGAEWIGMLCLMDEAPRSLDPKGQQTLAEFARLIADIVASGVPSTPEEPTPRAGLRLFDGHGALMVLVDPQSGHIVDANPSAAAFYGCTVDELKTRSLPELSTLPAERVMPAIHRALRSECPEVAFRHRQASGETRIVEGIVSEIEVDERSLLCLVGRDVTGKHREAEALRGTERSLRSFYDSSPLMMGIVELHGDETMQLSGNEATSRFAAITESDLNGDVAEKMGLPDDVEDLWVHAYRQSAVDNKPFWFEYDHPHASGVRRLKSVVNCIGLSSDGMPQFSYVSEDVTEKRQTERALQAKSLEFERIFTTAPDAILLSGPDRRLRAVNPAACRLFGYTAEALEGESEALLYADPGAFDLLNVTEPWNEACPSESEGEDHPAPHRLHYRRGDETTFIGETVGVPLYGAAGEPLGHVRTIRDVTAQEEAAATLREARSAAERASAWKSEFIATICHEIRTPLTAMLGFADLLTDVVPPEESDVPDLVLCSGQRLLGTLNSVIDLASLEAEGLEVDLAYTDAAAVVSEAARLLHPLAEGKGLALSVHVPAAPVGAKAEASLLARVVDNLVANAVTFTSEGGVTIEVAEEGGEVVLRVSDTSEGISPQFLPYLFEAYRPTSGGVGRNAMGLAVTRRLVELMGGQIDVESKPEEGVTFTVRLPRSSGKGVEGETSNAVEGSDAVAVRT